MRLKLFFQKGSKSTTSSIVQNDEIGQKNEFGQTDGQNEMTCEMD